MISAMTLILVLDGDVPLRTCYGVYISKLISLQVCHEDDVNSLNKCLTANISNKVVGIIYFETFFFQNLSLIP